MRTLRENIIWGLLLLLSLFWALGAHAAESNASGRRLRVENVPELPASVAAVLHDRSCTIPQPSQEAHVRNVIRGKFFRKGQRGWAVLCSSGGKSSILVFRDSHDSSPDEIAESADHRFIIDTWEGKKVYSREISAVNRDFILRHYHSYGGLQPPPIDHDGIDDASLEKASTTWYWYKGRWMQLQGAD